MKCHREKPRTYQEKDNVIWFDIGVELTEDVLIRCRHYVSSEERISIFRILFHPAFAFTEVVRFFKVTSCLLRITETEGY